VRQKAEDLDNRLAGWLDNFSVGKMVQTMVAELAV
jgi:hypothetical protein